MRFKAKLRIVRCALVILLLTLTALMTGCHRETASLKIIGDTFYYDPDKVFDYESYFAELEARSRPETEVPADITVQPDTEATPVAADTAEVSVVTDTDAATDTETEQAVTPDVDTVYWVKSGDVWHLSADCPSLSRSKNVISGTVTAAMAQGKTRVCKRCGN